MLTEMGRSVRCGEHHSLGLEDLSCLLWAAPLPGPGGPVLSTVGSTTPWVGRTCPVRCGQHHSLGWEDLSDVGSTIPWARRTCPLWRAPFPGLELQDSKTKVGLLFPRVHVTSPDKIPLPWAGKMAYGLIAWPALSKGQSLIPSTTCQITTICYSSSRESEALF